MTAIAADLKVVIPDRAREPCAAAPLPPYPSASEIDHQAFGAEQTGQLEVCDTKRALAVAAGDLHNIYVDRLVETVKPRSMWGRLTGKRPGPPPRPSLDDLVDESLRRFAEGAE